MPTRGLAVARTLRDKVLDGDFGPGMRLTESELSEQLGVSRTPIRNALSVLAAEGLVDHAPNSGFTVRHVTAKDVEGVYDCRAVLEGLAARTVAERGLSDTGRGLIHRNITEAAQLQQSPWSETVRIEWARLNEEFHDTIFREADNPYLQDLIRKTRAVPQLRKIKFQWHNGDLMAISSRDHEAIFDALSSGQGARAEYLSREHVYQAGRRLAENWRRAAAQVPEEVG